MGQTFFFILFLSLFSISFISAKFVPAKLIREQYEFFHISDIHYDPLANPILYNASTYCRPPSSENIGTIDHSTHTKGGGVWDSPAGQYGRYGCDTPDELLTSVLIGMQKINSNPDFIIFTGDSPAHNLSPSDQIDAIDHVITRIFTVFSGTSIIPTIGNNDVYPDYTVSCNDPRIYEIYKSYNEFIPSEMAATFLQMGSFMNPVVQGLRVISLNTVLYSSRNTAISGDDPCGQFAWFSGELNAARNSGDKVYIVGHIFPGIDPDKLLPLWYPSYITKYIDIVSQYSDIIYGSFFGHVHRDEFRILNDPSNVKSPPQASILASSSVSPIYANNPTFRIYYTNASFGLDDYADYILDLPQANVMNYANWSMEYSFHDSYGQEFINTDNLANVYKQIQNQANIFSEWYDRRVGQYQASKQASLCVLNSPDSISFDDCMNQPYV